MARSLTAREIQTLILSYHPIIVIETVEEERVARLLQRAAAVREEVRPLHSRDE